MERSRFTEEQIIEISREQELGMKTAELRRERAGSQDVSVILSGEGRW